MNALLICKDCGREGVEFDGGGTRECYACDGDRSRGVLPLKAKPSLQTQIDVLNAKVAELERVGAVKYTMQPIPPEQLEKAREALKKMVEKTQEPKVEYIANDRLEDHPGLVDEVAKEMVNADFDFFGGCWPWPVDDHPSSIQARQEARSLAEVAIRAFLKWGGHQRRTM